MNVVGRMLYAHTDDPERVGEKVRATAWARVCSRACRELLHAL